MRLIDADALMKELEREVELADDWKTAHEIVNVVKYFPTIEPEQKKGKWIKYEDDECISGTCSYCGWDALLYETDVVGMPFCPNCGAKMEGEKWKKKENMD